MEPGPYLLGRQPPRVRLPHRKDREGPDPAHGTCLQAGAGLSEMLQQNNCSSAHGRPVADCGRRPDRLISGGFADHTTGTLTGSGHTGSGRPVTPGEPSAFTLRDPVHGPAGLLITERHWPPLPSDEQVRAGWPACWGDRVKYALAHGERLGGLIVGCQVTGTARSTGQTSRPWPVAVTRTARR